MRLLVQLNITFNMDNFEAMVNAIGKLGVSMQEAVEAMQRLNQAMIDLLRPVSSVPPENPNPKIDLEIFEQNVVSKIEPMDKLPDWYLEML
jgi:hypothetical protein